MNHLKSAMLLTFALSSAYCGIDGEQLTESKCTVCHMSSNPTVEQVKNMVAPPMWGVVRHLKRDLKDQKSFVNFVSDYILEPSKEKIRFNKEAMKRFGLMPSMKGTISEEEAKIIAEYLYKTY